MPWHVSFVSCRRTVEEFDMNKIALLAITITGIISSAAFAEESTLSFENAKAILEVSTADHEAALARNGKELSRGTTIYKHEGKLYSSNCLGSYIGGWEQGYPGTENDC
jgi:hypothetical protein